MRRSAKSRHKVSQSSIAIMADAIKAKEQNLSYGKYKALDMLGPESMLEEETSEYAVYRDVLVRKTVQTEEKKAVAYVKVRAV